MSAHDTHVARPQHGRTKVDIDVLIGYVLLLGVILSVILVLAGLAWAWIRTGHLGVQYTISRTNLFQFVVADLGQLWAGALRPRLLTSLGIAVLMLTPYVRVLASLLFFALVEHNWKYVLFTGFVLAVLTYTLFLR
jgi:uncharacterized membrane protein